MLFFVLWHRLFCSLLALGDADLRVHSKPAADVPISFLPGASVFYAHTFLEASFRATIFPAWLCIKGIFCCKG